MIQFEERPLTTPSKYRRRKIYGVGINDAEYVTHYRIGGRELRCPFYNRWHDLLKRCFSIKFHEKNPTYKACILCHDWCVFSKFKQWMIGQNWQNRQLDKDLLIPGNKIYAPDRCLFIPQALNKLVTVSLSSRGLYPIGVHYHKQNRKYVASIHLGDGQKYIGSFKTPEDAHKAYIEVKNNYILKLAKQYEITEPKLSLALIQHIHHIGE